jgi:glycosyltransferase domain-containing protein
MKRASNLQQLDKLTVIILSKERKELLGHTLSFWNGLGCQVIVVHDSSKVLEVSNFGDHIRYINTPHSIFKRLAIAVPLVNTPYAVIANDDEIYLPNALDQIVSHLELNAELHSCAGQALAYNWVGRRLLGLPLYPFLLNYSNTSDSGKHRVSKIIQAGNWMDLLAVHRTTSFKKIALATSKFEGFSTPYMYEVMFSIFSNLLGKSERLNLLFWGRNWYEPYHFIKGKWDRKITWQNWYSQDSFESERIRWRGELENCLIELNNDISVQNLENFKWLEEEFKKSFENRHTPRETNGTKLISWIKTIFNQNESSLLSQLSWTIQSKIPGFQKRVIPKFSDGLRTLSKSDIKVISEDIKILSLFIKEQKAFSSLK